jgi:hypothetical protein
VNGVLGSHLHGKHLPLARHTLEFVLPTVGEHGKRYNVIARIR